MLRREEAGKVRGEEFGVEGCEELSGERSGSEVRHERGVLQHAVRDQQVRGHGQQHGLGGPTGKDEGSCTEHARVVVGQGHQSQTRQLSVAVVNIRRSIGAQIHECKAQQFSTDIAGDTVGECLFHLSVCSKQLAELIGSQCARRKQGVRVRVVLLDGLHDAAEHHVLCDDGRNAEQLVKSRHKTFREVSHRAVLEKGSSERLVLVRRGEKQRQRILLADALVQVPQQQAAEQLRCGERQRPCLVEQRPRSLSREQRLEVQQQLHVGGHVTRGDQIQVPSMHCRALRGDVVHIQDTLALTQLH